jgi:hypothetical protein
MNLTYYEIKKNSKNKIQNKIKNKRISVISAVIYEKA